MSNKIDIKVRGIIWGKRWYFITVKEKLEEEIIVINFKPPIV